MSACWRKPSVSMGQCSHGTKTCIGLSSRGCGPVQDRHAHARRCREHHHQHAFQPSLRHDRDRRVLGDRGAAHGARLHQQALDHAQRGGEEQDFLRQRAARRGLGALHVVQRRPERRGALQDAQLDAPCDRLAGADRRARVLRLPRRQVARARHAHRVPRPGRADADRAEGQAAALLRRPVRQARLAHARRAAARRARLLGLLARLQFDARIGVVVSANFLAVAARMSLVQFLGIYFVHRAGIAVTTVGLAFLCESLARGLAAPMFGALSDRWGRRPLLLASSLCTAVILPAFLLVRDPGSLLVWSAVLGLAGAVNIPVSSALLLDLAPPARRQSVLALNYTAMSVAYTLGVVPAGYIAEQGYGLLAAVSAAGYVPVALLYAAALRGALLVENLASGPGRRGAYQGAWTLVSSLSMGSALALSGVVSGTFGWEGAWLGCAALTALAAVALSLSRQRFVR